jgi:hypothetical protein
MSHKKQKKLINENEKLKEISKYINGIYYEEKSEKEKKNSEKDNNNI